MTGELWKINKQFGSTGVAQIHTNVWKKKNFKFIIFSTSGGGECEKFEKWMSDFSEITGIAQIPKIVTQVYTNVFKRKISKITFRGAGEM